VEVFDLVEIFQFDAHGKGGEHFANNPVAGGSDIIGRIQGSNGATPYAHSSVLHTSCIVVLRGTDLPKHSSRR
jgi:hypothetical protein